VVSKPAMRKWIWIFVCLTQVCRLQAQREQDPIQAILQLFEQHPIVMFGEVHGCVQEHALLKRLVTAPEFAARVNDVVIEMGNSLYQEVLDRYIAGENVPTEQLRKTWENVVGAPGGSPLLRTMACWPVCGRLTRSFPRNVDFAFWPEILLSIGSTWRAARILRHFCRSATSILPA
jgi:hypothetical protein